MAHPALPQTMTKEALGDWIHTNRVDTKNHVQQIPLTEEEIINLQRESSLASRAIDKLEDLEKQFREIIKKGTHFDTVTGQHKPMTFTIPPTKGSDTLKKNRKFADDQLEKGYREEITTLYMIPWPEQEKLVAVDIEGSEWRTYSRDMSEDEIRQYGKPILKVSNKSLLDD